MDGLTYTLEIASDPATGVAPLRVPLAGAMALRVLHALYGGQPTTAPEAFGPTKHSIMASTNVPKTPKDAAASGSAIGRARFGTGIPALLRDYMARTRTFTTSDAYAYVLAIHPECSRGSIRTSLSEAVRKGHIERVGEGSYKSLIFGTEPTQAEPSRNGSAHETPFGLTPG